MAKQSKLDEKIVECRQEIAASKDVTARWEGLLLFLTDGVPGIGGVGAPAVTPPKRTRGKAKNRPGLPPAPNSDDESIRMAVDGK